MAHQYGYPSDLPVPVDDGACQHLEGREFPANIRLIVTPPTAPKDGGYSGMKNALSISELSKKSIVLVFIYPRTGVPGESVPEEWDAIPGARGCTPQNCAYVHPALLPRYGLNGFLRLI